MTSVWESMDWIAFRSNRLKANKARCEYLLLLLKEIEKLFVDNTSVNYKQVVGALFESMKKPDDSICLEYKNFHRKYKEITGMRLMKKYFLLKMS